MRDVKAASRTALRSSLRYEARVVEKNVVVAVAVAVAVTISRAVLCDLPSSPFAIGFGGQVAALRRDKLCPPWQASSRSAKATQDGSPLASSSQESRGRGRGHQFRWIHRERTQRTQRRRV